MITKKETEEHNLSPSHTKNILQMQNSEDRVFV